MQHVVCAALLGIAMGVASPVLAQQFTFATGDRTLQGYNARAVEDDNKSGGGGVDAAGQLPNSPYQSNLVGRDTLPRAATQTAMFNPYSPLSSSGIGSATGFGTGIGTGIATGVAQGNAPGGFGDNPGMALSKPPGSYEFQHATLQAGQFGGDCATCAAVHHGAAVDGAGLVTPGTSGGAGGAYTFKFQTGEARLTTPGAPPVPPVATFVTASRVTSALTPSIVTTPKIIAPSIVTPAVPVVSSTVVNPATQQFNAPKTPDATRGFVKAN